ncbi:Pectinesterase inhibitor [Corchorus olitorius]|uniref:Pectinesterase inhibitor n=1 Tax=Corchorus olitorius TaxID=93759 RepID=A0A1R3KXI8_9ROSI|nr:Pectinesterase inhibitor [Corchorus olitorius]
MVLNQNFSSAAIGQCGESLISKACNESRNPDLLQKHIRNRPVDQKGKKLQKPLQGCNGGGYKYDNALYALNIIAILAFNEKNYYEAYHAVSIAGHCATACNDVCHEGGLTMFQQHNNEIYAFTSVVQSLFIKLVSADQLRDNRIQ